ncbi:hypothetical protein SNEBB_001108, partial [Seison nebaliae]
MKIEISSYKESIELIRRICADLSKEGYHGINMINNRMKNIDRLWDYLMELIRIRSMKLLLAQKVFGTISNSFVTLKMIETKSKKLNEEPVEELHLHQMEDLVKRHKMSLCDMIVYEDLVKNDLVILHSFIEGRSIDDRVAGKENCDMSNVVEISGWRPVTSEQLTNIHNKLKDNWNYLKNEIKLKNEKLALGIDMWKHLWNMAVEIEWIRNRLRELSPEMTRKLLNENCQIRTQIALNRHQMLEDQINSRIGQLDDLKENGKKLMRRNESFIPSLRCMIQLNTCDERLRCLWKKLIEIIEGRGRILKDKMNFSQLKNDIEDVDYELDEMMKSLQLFDMHFNQDDRTIKCYLNKIERQENEFSKYEELIRLKKSQIFEMVDEFKKDKLENKNVKKEIVYVPNGIYTTEEEKLLRNDYLSNMMDYEVESNELLALSQKLGDKMNLMNDMMKLKKMELFSGIEYDQFIKNSDRLEMLLDQRIRFVSLIFDLEDDGTKSSEVKTSEGIDLLQHRFNSLENDMIDVANRVASYIQQGHCMEQKNYLMVENIDKRRRCINDKWVELRRLINEKKEKLATLIARHNYEIDSQETAKWIKDKICVVESTEELKKHLDDVIQKRMKSDECDLDV